MLTTPCKRLALARIAASSAHSLPCPISRRASHAHAHKKKTEETFNSGLFPSPTPPDELIVEHIVQDGGKGWVREKVTAVKVGKNKAPLHGSTTKGGKNTSSHSFDRSKSKKGKAAVKDASSLLRTIVLEGEPSTSGFSDAKWKDALAVGEGFGNDPRHTSRLKHDPLPHGSTAEYEVEGMLTSSGPVLIDVEPTQARPPIATLAHGLDRVLFNPGVTWVQDPRSRVYNFTPWIQDIPKVEDFDFNRLPGFVPSSRDIELRTLAAREKKRFAGSTSSLTGLMSQCYFLISETNEVDTSSLSLAFKAHPKSFSPGQRWPVSVNLNYKDGIYTIDSAPQDIGGEKLVLPWLGVVLEKFLTTNPEAFKSYLKSSSPSSPATKVEREAYRYAKSNDFIMRSQLDCVDPRLPGTGVFDIKTRACVAARLDPLNYEEHAGYTIRTQHGLFESFEKEYCDLIRSAFLKYSFQARIGNMDGVIVAYHNTGRMFGFQYIPVAEMDAALYGSAQAGVGDRVFEKCVGLLEKVMSEVVTCYPKQSVTVTFETKVDTRGMNVWVEPLEWEGEEEKRPIEQFRVESSSYSGGDVVKGIRAATRMDEHWALRYTIQKLVLKHEAKRLAHSMARARHCAAYKIPSGVEESQLEEWWNNLNHGSSEGSVSTAKFDPSIFSQPSASIERLREISRKGTEDAAKEKELYKGTPTVVWQS